MMRLMISVLAAVVVIGVAATVLYSKPHSLELTAAAMPSLVELHTMAGVNKLPAQDVEDQSLIFPSTEKR
jgi:deoxyinosine 3'endonuclease (endonuclease V)